MATKNETFLLAKINVLEHATAQFMALFPVLLKNPDVLRDVEHNMRKGWKERAVVRDGAGEGAIELQTEILKQLDYFFLLVRHYEENTTPKS